MNKTKRRIFNTAIKIFSEKGYDNSSVEEITAIASGVVGVTASSLIYRLKKNREVDIQSVYEGFINTVVRGISK